jgi:hypothetical protein
MDDIENTENDGGALTETEQNDEAQAAVDKLLAELQPKHGALRGFFVEGHGAFVFKKGGHADWKRSKAARLQVLTKPEVVAMANINLARSLLVHPTAALWDAFAAEEPGAADELGAEIFNGLDGKARVILGKATS